MDESQLPSILAEIVGSENVVFQQHELLTYAAYFSSMWTKDAPRSYFPDVVVKPRTTTHIVEVVRLANERKIPVIPWGGGTGNTGGTLALTGGILLDLRAMNTVLELDKGMRWVKVQAGVILESLEKKLERQGLMLGHDPGSFFSATVGGAISTSGVGVISTGYGAMKDMVMGLEVVLPTGDVIRTKPVDKSSTVLENLNYLFIGTEGTFGIITEVTLRVHPLPETRSIHVLGFQDVKDAMKMSFHLTEIGIKPVIQHAIDYRRAVWFAPMLQDFKKIGGILITGFDGPQEIVEANDTVLLKIANKYGCKDLGQELSKDWWEHRHDYPSIGRYWLEKAEVSSFPSFHTFLEMYDRFVNLTEKHELEFFGAGLYANRSFHHSHLFPNIGIWASDYPPAPRKKSGEAPQGQSCGIRMPL